MVERDRVAEHGDRRPRRATGEDRRDQVGRRHHPVAVLVVLVDADRVESAVLGEHELIDVGLVHLGEDVTIEDGRIEIDPDAAMIALERLGERWVRHEVEPQQLHGHHDGCPRHPPSTRALRTGDHFGGLAGRIVPNLGTVTAVDTAPRTGGRSHLALGSRGFVAVLSMCMAVTALGVDTILPAYGEIRESLGLADDATEVTGLITFYLMGNSLGLLPAGLLADRFGRKAVMWGGLALYVVGAVGSIFAPSLTLMFVARFVWGLGGAGPRVAALAMVRDGFAGEQMAKQMSFVMAVFLLVPAIGPTLSAGILAVGPWQAVFWMCTVAAVAVMYLVTRLPATLPPEARRPLARREIWESCRIVLTSPGNTAYLVSLTALFGVFMSYLASSELIVDQTFGLKEWFPAFFGGLALVMLVAMLVNGRFVERMGLTRLLRIVFLGNLVAVALLLIVALLTSGEPPFWLFVVLIGAVLFSQQMLIPNINAAAMQPLAHVAGTGTAILGMVSGVLGAIIGEIINRQFDGTVTPLAIGFLVSSIVAVAAWRRADATSVPALPDRLTL